MPSVSLNGIFPITLTPFDADRRIDEASLRRVVHFELDGGVHGLGVGGFASEGYKLTDDERWRCVSIVAEEIDGRAPLIIGMAAGSTDAAIAYAERYAALRPTVTVNAADFAKLDQLVAALHLRIGAYDTRRIA